MQGRYVFKHAVTRFTEVINEALAATGLPPTISTSHSAPG
jgi:3-oxoacyl-[acyl-carrier-protein] synthase III